MKTFLCRKNGCNKNCVVFYREPFATSRSIIHQVSRLPTLDRFQSGFKTHFSHRFMEAKIRYAIWGPCYQRPRLLSLPSRRTTLSA